MALGLVLSTEKVGRQYFLYICKKQNHYIMEEDIKKDPRDINGDGKVTLEEKLTYAATVASEKLSKAAGEVKEGAKKLYDKAAPKAKEVFAEAREKGEALAEKAHDQLESLKKKKEPEDDTAKA